MPRFAASSVASKVAIVLAALLKRVGQRDDDDNWLRVEVAPMAIYVCRKDGVDLTSEVQITIDHQGHDTLVEPIVQGLRAPDLDAVDNHELWQMVDGLESSETILVTCPKCGTDNQFVIVVDRS